MRISQHTPGTANVIRRYSDACIWVAERSLTMSCLITAEQVVADWPPHNVAQIALTDLAAIFELDPEVVILATGTSAQFPAPAVRAAFGTRKIGFEVMALGAACRTYNVLIAEGRRALIAVLFAPAGASR